VSRYQAYPDYKDSGVEFLDSLPTGWRTLRGKYVFSEYSERSESGEEQLLSVSEYYGVKPRGEVIEEGDFLSRAESLVGYKKCQKNDLVMNIMLAWKCGLGISKFDGIVSPAYSVFRFNCNASPDYMHYLLRTDTYTGHFKTRSTGVIDSRLRLYPESFGDVSLVLPSINEQEKIVAFLDHETAKIDALIEKQQRLIELLKEKRQAVISHAVTKGLNPNAPMKDSGVEWLGPIPIHWVSVPLKRICALKTGLTPPTDNESNYSDEESLLHWIRPEDLNEKGEATTGSKYLSESGWQLMRKIPPQSTLICCIGTIGKIGFVENTVTTNQQITAAIFECSKRFNFYLTNAARNILEESATGNVIKILNSERLGNINFVSIPPEEAENIAAFLDHETAKIDALIEKQQRLIELAQERRTALISAAVTGKIDVRDWQPAAAQAVICVEC
jgi:type I restriction enzyme S subunit